MIMVELQHYNYTTISMLVSVPVCTSEYINIRIYHLVLLTSIFILLST